MKLSRHIRKCLQQRGMRNSDANLICHYGTQVGDGFLLRRRDVAVATSELKRAIIELERLEGRLVIIRGDLGVTAYKASLNTQKRCLREGR